MDFVFLIKNACLEDLIAKMNPTMLVKLRNPVRMLLIIENKSIRHSIQSYLSLKHASQRAYNGIIASTQFNFPEAHNINGCLSFRAVKSFLAANTGIDHVLYNMCPNSCVGFTGPFANLENCPLCQKSC